VALLASLSGCQKPSKTTAPDSSPATPATYAPELYGETAVVDDRLPQRIFFLRELDCLIDTMATATFDVIRSDSSGFRKLEFYQNKDFLRDRPYWIRFPVTYASPSDKIWLVEFY